MLVKTKSLDLKPSRPSKSATLNPFQSAFEASRVAMVLLDASRPGFPVVVANKAFLHLSGRLGTRVAGRPFLSLLGPVPDGAGAVEKLLQDGRGGEVDVPQSRRSGEPVWCRLSLSRLADGPGPSRYVLASYVDLSDRRRTEAELRSALDQATLLLRESDHRVKNNLQVVSSLVLLSARRMADPNTRQALYNLTERISALTTVQRLMSNTRNGGGLDLVPFVTELATDILDLLPRGQVRLDLEVEEIVLPGAKAVPLALLLNELIGNAVKHAFPQGRKGQILVRVATEGPALQIRVADDGVGTDPTRSGGGFGTILIDLLARQLRGTLARTTAAPGTRVDATIPLESDTAPRPD
ncbi:MAG: histidine kinase dimerization/phosphoacceptor domain -containing protein [Microvirga sp.]